MGQVLWRGELRRAAWAGGWTKKAASPIKNPARDGGWLEVKITDYHKG
jgi:hypothetical protein